MAGISSIQSVISKVEQFEGDLERFTYADACIKENEQKVIQLNLDQLYNYGENSKGVSIGSYSPYTINLKKEKGQPYDRVTLKDTGDFYRGFFIRTFGDGFAISSSDDKARMLAGDWGESIFGLSYESRSKLCHGIILPYVLDKLNSIIYGNV